MEEMIPISFLIFLEGTDQITDFTVGQDTLKFAHNFTTSGLFSIWINLY